MKREDMNIIKLARIGVLNNRDKLLIKKDTSEGVNISTEGSVLSQCLVGPQLEADLHRDKGLFVIRKPTPGQIENYRK